MPTSTLIIDGVIALAIAGVYAYVARLFRQRAVQHADARFAAGAFVTWWVGVTIVTGLIGVRSVLAGLDLLAVDAYETLSTLIMLGVSLALWGIVYYLTYIHSGNPRWIVPVTLYHTILLAALIYRVMLLDPTSIEPKAWTIVAHSARPIEGAGVYALYLGILGPAILAAILYGALYFRTTERVARYRIAVVSLSFLVWFGSTLIGGVLRFHESFVYWPPASRIIGLAAALTVIAAYRPPTWIQRQLVPSVTP